MEGFRKAGPTASGIILVFRTEKWFATDHIHIDAFFGVVPVLVLKRRLRLVQLGHFILELGEPFLQLLIFFPYLPVFPDKLSPSGTFLVAAVMEGVLSVVILVRLLCFVKRSCR